MARASKINQPAGAADSSSAGRLLSLEAGAAYIGVSYWTLRDLVAAGTVPRVRLLVTGGRDLRRVLVDRRDLDALIESSKERGL